MTYRMNSQWTHSYEHCTHAAYYTPTHLTHGTNLFSLLSLAFLGFIVLLHSIIL